MNLVCRGIIVATVASGLVAGGRVALRKAPGDAPQPLTATQLTRLNEKLASEIAADETALERLQVQELNLEGSIAELQQTQVNPRGGAGRRGSRVAGGTGYSV